MWEERKGFPRGGNFGGYWMCSLFSLRSWFHIPQNLVNCIYCKHSLITVCLLSLSKAVFKKKHLHSPLWMAGGKQVPYSLSAYLHGSLRFHKLEDGLGLGWKALFLYINYHFNQSPFSHTYTFSSDVLTQVTCLTCLNTSSIISYFYIPPYLIS